MHIGERIRKIRRLKDLSQEYLATKLGVSQNYIQKIESNKVNLTLLKVEQLADALEVEMSELIPSTKNEFNNCTNSGNFYCHITHHVPDELIELLKSFLKNNKA
jgi:transcriptional regulator with XRE-family HTH domain